MTPIRQPGTAELLHFLRSAKARRVAARSLSPTMDRPADYQYHIAQTILSALQLEAERWPVEARADGGALDVERLAKVMCEHAQLIGYDHGAGPTMLGGSCPRHRGMAAAIAAAYLAERERGT
jgi:hypothetical protein